MNRENIQKLIDRLRKVPEGAFDLSRWLAVDDPEPLGFEWAHDAYEGLTTRAEIAKLVLTKQDASAGAHTCGTVGCIAGYAAVIALAEDGVGANQLVSDVAEDWLGLDHTRAKALFTPNCYSELFEATSTLVRANYVPEYRAVKPRHAVAVLEHLLATGEVDWRRAGWTPADYTECFTGVAEDA
jgi:hypothetical protein